MTRRPSPEWVNTTNDRRKRKMITITLSDKARARLDELACTYGSVSAAVEAAVDALVGVKPRRTVQQILDERRRSAGEPEES